LRRYRVDLDEGALEDLSAIRRHIADASGRSAADRFLCRVLQHFEGFASAPKRGVAREDLRPGLRVVGWRRVLTLAFVVDDAAAQVTILAVYYRGRDVEAALRRRWVGDG